jgi:hypothetical protein
MHMKNPVLAAAFNFILPGSAYIYLKQRVVFGCLILSAELLLWIVPLPQIVDEAVSLSLDNFQLSDWLPIFVAALLCQIAFALDAYRSAKAHNKMTAY